MGAYWRAQLFLSSSTPLQSGSELRWSWTLPAHLPRGKCVRVTVPGGTLTQGTRTIPWDDHGYYEVALDEGSVTLSP